MNKLAAYHFRGRASVPSQRWGRQGRSRRGPRLRLLDVMRDALGEQARKAVSEALTNDPFFEFEPSKGYGGDGLAADRGLRLRDREAVLALQFRGGFAGGAEPLKPPIC